MRRDKRRVNFSAIFFQIRVSWSEGGFLFRCVRCRWRMGCRHKFCGCWLICRECRYDGIGNGSWSVVIDMYDWWWLYKINKDWRIVKCIICGDCIGRGGDGSDAKFGVNIVVCLFREGFGGYERRGKSRNKDSVIMMDSGDGWGVANNRFTTRYRSRCIVVHQCDMMMFNPWLEVNK